MTIQRDEEMDSIKVRNIFWTMRMNLATLEAFLRKSFISPTLQKADEIELGFLGIQSKEDQIKIHNQSIMRIQIALLFQALDNYFEMIKINPELRDQDLNAILDQFGNIDEFIGGMRTIRNCIFHIQNPNQREKQSLATFDEVCNQKGGSLEVLCKLRKALYQFTEKCFFGELRVFPNHVYDMMENEKPEILERFGIRKPEIKKPLSK